MNISTETCPPLEDIAAFLDGKLSGEERARIVAHLAECESCYAIFADAARFQLEEEQEASVPADRAKEDSGTVVPFPKRSLLTWAGSLAALLLIGLATSLLYQQYNDMPVLIASEIIDPAVPNTDSIGEWAERLRGGESEAPLIDSPAEFLLGANLVDLRLALARNEEEKADQALARINQQMPNLLAVPEEAKFYQEARSRITEGTQPQSLLAEADRVEGSLTDFLSPATYLAFGKWTEAGRLSAEARSADFFQDRENRRFLRVLLRKAEEEGLDPKVEAALRQIQLVLEEGLQERGFLKTTAYLQAILDHYQVEARRGSEI